MVMISLSHSLVCLRMCVCLRICVCLYVCVSLASEAANYLRHSLLRVCICVLVLECVELRLPLVSSP